MSKKLLVLGVGGHRELGIKTLVKRGEFTTILIDTFENRGFSSFFDEKLYIDKLDHPQEILRLIEGNLEVSQIAGVITFSEHLVPIASWISNKLQLPGINYEASLRARNKLLMRKSLNQTSVKQPEFHFLENNETDIASINSFPGVIKPVDMAASIGVKRINSKEELAAALKDIPDYNGRGYIYEEYIEGKEFSAEGFIQFGKPTTICITEKEVDDSNNSFVEEGHLLPYPFEESTKRDIENKIKEIVMALGLDNCIFHLEFKLSPDNQELFFIEVGARPAGDFICDLVYHAIGVNIYDLQFDIALGQEINYQPRSVFQYAGIKFLEKGEFELNENTGYQLLNIRLSKKSNDAGQKFSKSNTDRSAFVQLAADSYKELKAEMKRSYDCTIISY
ncbi:ATP-grasp domain-containing protein [Virgibacillus sp. AGTR]|uniref:ATP-grasp domain-containing protein n=1 Tax=Virgibacillus sp. AGTR TaxID=2812055 RepID=UPI001D16C2E0|nr:ATP-grasp domain-containing protein [Virgibacillus sp. AGTR]MCC2252143.1 ATP-grasp domain-containing protein [Virgibacillus sp. AGTR]